MIFGWERKQDTRSFSLGSSDWSCGIANFRRPTTSRAMSRSGCWHWAFSYGIRGQSDLLLWMILECIIIGEVDGVNIRRIAYLAML